MYVKGAIVYAVASFFGNLKLVCQNRFFCWIVLLKVYN